MRSQGVGSPYRVVAYGVTLASVSTGPLALQVAGGISSQMIGTFEVQDEQGTVLANYRAGQRQDR